ncbi:hypothetical protein LTR53_003330 [Teratosphaeriaceae sp. CCFEE 6253]|nr:hypothetical protein LTR53_003330 [Teratosphaeriaceae sp. CCFEE 6253]
MADTEKVQASASREDASAAAQEIAIPKAEVATTDRRKSHMSFEDPTSPGSSSGDSILTESDHDRHSHEYEKRGRGLAPHLSRTSSAGAIGGVTATSLNRTYTGRSLGATSTGGLDAAFEVDFTDGDPGDPQQWPLWYKGLLLFIMSYGTTCVVLYSTSYTSAIPGMEATFGINDTLGVLGVTTYLFGMATGAVILAPLSEMFVDMDRC